MPNLPHLILPRIELERPRRKTGFGHPPERNYGEHGRELKSHINQVMDEFQKKSRPEGINPNLILRVQLDEKSMIDEKTWERCGLTLLSIDKDRTLILFASDQDLTSFQKKLNEYQNGPSKKDQKNAPYTQIFASINAISELRPIDRIGRLFRAEGLKEPKDFDFQKIYIVDIEIWDLGDPKLLKEKINEIIRFIKEKEGNVTDQYIGMSMILLRARCSGELVQELLEIESIASIDFPPQPGLTISELINLGIEDFPPVDSPPEHASSVAVLDSGIISSHPLIAPAIGEAVATPRSIGDSSDNNGHGTMVSGLALYGDVETCIANRNFNPELWLYSIRVLNADNRFDDNSLITSQMESAIKYIYQNYNCRIFNISLGDERLPYNGGKVSPWASILDTLARELNIVIVVSAGNLACNRSPDFYMQKYPHYLLEEDASIIEPATGAIVLTVGSLANSANIPTSSANDVSYRPIAQIDQPSPFTRSGFGLGGSIKPELCDYGGNYAYHGLINSIRKNIELSVISLNHKYLDRLFNVDVGTSFSAPKISYQAAKLFGKFPDASANLIRAFLAASASIPEPAYELLNSIGYDAVYRLCGYGKPNFEKAHLSDENRVVLYADSEIELDNFHIYEIPVPEEFIQNNGERSISVALAFDPPVRHSRFDYLGVKMSYRLIRGKTIDQIVAAYRHREKKEEKAERISSTKYDCKMNPKSRFREGSTLQKSVFTMKLNPHPEYGEVYYLIVRCEKKWAKTEHSPQKYAVVITLEHSNEIDIYNPIRQKIAIRARV